MCRIEDRKKLLVRLRLLLLATLLISSTTLPYQRTSAQPPTIITVDTTSAVVDGNTSNVTNLLADRGDDGVISFLEALTAVNRTGAGHTINFDLAHGATISFDFPLMLSASNTVINGDVDGDDVPDVVLDGPDTYISLEIISANNVIENLVVTGLTFSTANANNNRIDGNYVGTDISGTAARTEHVHGVLIMNGAHHNVIENNIIGGNSSTAPDTSNAGIFFFDGAHDNQVRGNWIGVGVNGSALPNETGIFVSSGSRQNVIGGTRGAGCTNPCNVISGNSGSGITIEDANTTLNLVQGNFIGVSPDGMNAMPNTLSGVHIRDGATFNTIGGARTSSACLGFCNVISGNLEAAVWIYDAATMSNTVIGNYIGVRHDGAIAQGNGRAGILISDGARQNTIGGSRASANCDGPCNVVSGNAQAAIVMTEAGTMANLVAGNFVGLNPAGTAVMRNGLTGVEIGLGATQNRIGGARSGNTCNGPCNVISGNGQSGVLIWGAGAHDNLVQGNYLGTNALGTVRLPNESHGVHVTGDVMLPPLSAASSTKEGSEKFPEIQVSEVADLGVEVAAPPVAPTAQGAAVQAPLASSAVQQQTNGRKRNQIGGDTQGTGNLISGNNLSGISLESVDTQETRIWGNYIGTDIFGNDGVLGNGAVGIQIVEASGTQVGGDDAAEGNFIAFNTAHGIYIALNSAISNTIRLNSIHHNGGLGIYIVEGAQNNIKPPALLANTMRAKGVGVPPNATIDVYIADQERTDSDGFGEGMTWVGSGTADGNGDYEFAITGVGEDDLLTATATDAASNTSQFSYQPALAALEVTQAIQDLNNSVLLVSQRPLFVRGHISRPPAGFGLEGTMLLGELAGRQGGVELPDSPLAIQNQGGFILLKEMPERWVLNDSFFFELPAPWRDGSVELEFRNLAFRCAEPANVGDNLEAAQFANDCRTNINFVASAMPEVALVPVTWVDANGQQHVPSPADIQSAAQEIEATFPIPYLNWGVSYPLPPQAGVVGPPLISSDFVAINQEIAWLRALDGCTGSCQRYYMGIVDDRPDVPSLSQASGQAELGGDVGSAYLHATRIVAHEFGHLADRRHVACFGDERGTDSSYPYPGGLISPYDDLSGPPASLEMERQILYGFDIRNNLPPSQVSSDSGRIRTPKAGDIMSYCTARWVSDYTYRHTRNYLLARFGPAPLAATAPLLTNANALIVSGIISPAANTATIAPLFAVDVLGAPAPPPSGEYVLRFENSQGDHLVSYSFDLLPQSEGETLSFAMLLPQVTGAERVILLHNEQELAVQTASATPPIVTILAPNGGETLSGTSTTVSWSASDNDGDTLSYVVQYSADGGSTWQTLVVDWPTTSYAVNLEWLAGSGQAQLRVLASDGFHTAQDQTDAPFVVPGHAPSPLIQGPANEQSFVGTQNVHFTASAYDIEDGLLGDGSFSWSSNLDGALGTGRALVVNAAALSEGTHVITLTAMDSAGSSAAANVTIHIYRVRPIFPAQLEIAPDAFSVIVERGSAEVQTQRFTLRNGGDGALDWAASADQGWIQLSETSGSVPGDLIVTLNPATLPVGEHTGTIIVSAPGASNNPQTLPVSLRVAVTGTNVRGLPEPNSHNVPSAANITFNFDQALDPNSVGPGTFIAHGMQTGRLAGNYSVDGAEIVLAPAIPFKAGEIVYVIATTGIRYLSGASPQRSLLWQFQSGVPTSSAGILSANNQRFLWAMDAAIGDLDGDEDLDLFLLRRFRDDLEDEGSVVLFNQGGGTLVQGDQIIPVEGFSIVEPTSAVALGDLDNDGDLDLFAVVENPARTAQSHLVELQVWFNDGNGGFVDSGQHLPLASGGGYRVALGDLDGDGNLDALVSEISTVTMWRNVGAGFFAAGQVISAVQSSWTLGDVDGDGDLDAFVVTQSNLPHQIWLNDGQATFADSGQRLGITNSSPRAALGDLDGDGDLDAVVSERGTSSQVWLNKGGEQGGEQGIFSHSSHLSAGFHEDVKLVDVDGDGDLDAIFDTLATSSEIWLNDGSGFLSGHSVFGNDVRITDSYFGDFDGNGTMDAFAVYSADNPEGALFLNKIGAGGQQSRLYFPYVDQQGGAATNELYLQYLRSAR